MSDGGDSKEMNGEVSDNVATSAIVGEEEEGTTKLLVVDCC